MLFGTLPSNAKKRIAAIDVGSNSIHLLVCEASSDGKIVPLAATKEQTRLADALDDRLMLDTDALTRTALVIKKMKDIAEASGAPIRAVGTHALREARNGQDFSDRLLKKTGVQVQIISGQEEARLVYLGVLQGFDISSQTTLILDIGGGSAEILVGQWGEALFSASLKLGAVRLTKKFLLSDPYKPEEVYNLRSYVVSRLEPVLAEIRKVGFQCAVGSAGTIKAVRAIASGLKKEPLPSSLHGMSLDRDEIGLVLEALQNARTVKEKKEIPGMDVRRADILFAGVTVLDTVSRLAGVSSWKISTSAIREGIVVDGLAREVLWQRGSLGDVRWRAMRNFAKRVGIDEVHAWHIVMLLMSIFDSMQALHGLSSVWKEYLRGAAFLHEAGLFVDYTAYHKHGAYLIQNSQFAGFSLREKDYLAMIVRYHRKRAPSNSDFTFSEFESDERDAVQKCAALLRLAVALDRGRRGVVQDVRILESGSGFCRLGCVLRTQESGGVDLLQIAAEKGPLEDALGVKLEVVLM